MSRRALWLGVLMLFGVVHLIGMFYTGGHLRVVRFVKRSRQLNVVDFAKAQQLGTIGGTQAIGAKAGTQEVATGPMKDPWGQPLPETLHANWKIQEPNQNLFKERLASCPGSEHATQLSKEGVGKARSVVEADWRVEGREEETLKEAVQLFRSAIKEDPNCRAAILNAAITLFGLAQNSEAKDLLRNWPGTTDDALDRKASLFAIILQEQDNQAQSNILQQYRQLAKRAPELAILYMGISPQDAGENEQGLKPMFLLTSRTDAPGAQYTLWAMRRLIMMQEFAEHMGGYPPLTKADADGWSQHWYISIPNMLPPYVLKTVQKYYRDMISNRILSREDQSGGGYQAVRYFSYNDAIARFMLGAYNQLIQRLADRPIKPTYTYFGGYVNAAVLTPHRDRQQCEYTMSVNLDINPLHAQCPLGYGTTSKRISPQDTGGSEPMPPPAERRYVYHRPGDGVLIRGRIITHWRDQMPPNFNCTQLFLHYVHGEFRLTTR